jgi:hypothetical protein
MNLFIQDLWADLREKRLWPVALALLVGLVAVPLVVAQPAEDPAPLPPVKEQVETPDSGVEVVAADNSLGKGSALDLFDPKDPFRPPEAVLQEGEDSSPAGAGSDSAAGAGASGDDDGGGSGGSSGGGTTDGGSGGTGGGAPPPQRRTTEQFTYVIDVSFRRNDRVRRIKGMTRLRMLPSQNTPLLIFLGVDASASNAVFLVDSTLEGAGEGTCKPKASECAFLYLGAGAEHEFTDEDGNSYTLRVDQIRRVKVRAVSSRGSRRPEEGSDASAQSKRFAPPVLSDLVASSGPDNSSQTSRRR